VHWEIEHHADCILPEPTPTSPLTLRLRPRSDGHQWLESFEMSVDPKPDEFKHVIDAEGNVVTVVRLDEHVHQFRVAVRSRIDTQNGSPFEIPCEGSRKSLPYSYPESFKWLLAPSRHRSIRRSDDDPVHDFAEQLRRGSDSAAGFLERLVTALSQQFDHQPDEGNPTQPVAVTLVGRRGTASDLAAVYIEASRAMGFAARYVSGYYAGQAEQMDAGRHAWAEIFLPGAGWVGFDPTLGSIVGERHIVLAAAADPRNASVCSGCPEHETTVVVRSLVSVLERATASSPFVTTKRRRA
jgi:transglutaminase-like putative cysteine protease